MSPRTALIVLAALIAVTVWFLHDTLLLAFAGVLLALVIRASAEGLARVLRIRPVWGVWMTVFAALAVAGVGSALLGNAVVRQVHELQTTLPVAVNNAIVQLRANPIGNWLLANVPNVNALVPDTAHLITRAGGFLSSALGVIVSVLIVIFIAIATALEPQLYAGGFIDLIPAAYRPRARQVLGELSATLRTWLVARLLTMIVTGFLVTIGLTVLHIPMAAALGLLAALLAFIPNIGAFLAALPAVILAFVIGVKATIAVVVMYVVVHILDDFIVSPVVERQVVKLPPVLTLLAQIVLGVGAGIVGIMLAAPLVAGAIVLARRLWVEDVAGGSSQIFLTYSQSLQEPPVA